MDQWYAYIGGAQYGPIGADEVRRWICEHRLTGADYLWAEGMEDWTEARNVDAFAADFASPAAVPQVTSRWYRPHRGGAVLALGIIGLVACFICGIIAWSMGNTDLREMDAGRMDPSGRGLTVAGKICGMISTIIAMVVLACYAVMFIFAFAVA